MPNDVKRKLRAILDRIVSSRALMDVPAIVAEARDQAAALKGAEGKQFGLYLDAITGSQTSAEASMAAQSAISLLDQGEPEVAAAGIADPPAATPARTRTQGRQPAARKRASGGKK